MRTSPLCMTLALVGLVLLAPACSDDGAPGTLDGNIPLDTRGDSSPGAEMWLPVDVGPSTEGQPPVGDGALDGVKPSDGVVPPKTDGAQPTADGPQPKADQLPPTCKKNCDCPQGMDCKLGKCVKSLFLPTYCCDKAGCPFGSPCKDSSGKFGLCPFSPPTCKSACDCKQGLDCVNSKCVSGTKPVYCCSKIGCPFGQACKTADGKASTCGAPQCKLACDCPTQGQTCLAGKCLTLPVSLYCCSKVGCPLNQICQKTDGTMDVCKGTSAACKVHCDCAQGQACLNGKCKKTKLPFYCCKKKPCPTGSLCYDPKNNAKTCK